ncbi:non-ribosomal peptide synthetase/type I polyketide synthase [Ancylobacter oerskovii]|uniref:Non-ribosomal peptide synthetase/type I polyketide synthase n=1 Tax=Ancylobacter oerskovii TaxID=459519 RepID=A0ABW4Z0G0_9HYPH|nr:non-ribosomal peptide synthetase/type I polyketide synthase [Ancylobacter oerskovii]MBS7542936.1 amino acid adenylation domain-containing protein [Ancylobacter oerskovii]
MNMHSFDPAAEDALRELLDLGAVAIVGVAGRFPGAGSVGEFWENLRRGVDGITHFAANEIDDSFGDAVHRDPNYVAARPILPDIDRFDAPFFGMHAREAALTDPQHRLLLECAWEGLEDAGHDPAAFSGAIGVFAGCSLNTYFLRHVCADRRVIEGFTDEFQVGQYPLLVGAGHDFLATRIAYKLGLHGPAMTVASACSTSLLAVAQAVQSLQTFQCDMALAGGASISLPQQRGYLHQAGGMVSPDGRCRPFDAAAGGTVFGSGVALVVLRRLEDALADGDQIYSVIRGCGVNNDGAGKVGFTSPSPEWQARAIAAAHQQAGITADTVGYVEAHGTATPLGDPIEFSGLTKAFRATTDRSGYCALGSVKANVGHLDAAAGATGLIKTALVLRNGEIPPLLHFERPNPEIDLGSSPFLVHREATAWPAGDAPRRTGTSAFGVGGTNVHVVMEEAPRPRARADCEGRAFVFPLSARSEAALAQARAALADHVANRPELRLDDIAHTLQQGRRAFDHRAAVVARSREELAQKLRGEANGGKAGDTRPVVFMFPGQGSQSWNMGRGLYDTEPLFRELVDRGAACVHEVTGTDIRDLLFAAVEPGDPNPLDATVNTQPALFLIQYATARLLMSWGIQPDAMVGHSLGELVSAVLAGVYSFEDAARAIAERGRLIYAQPPGVMLSVRLAVEELEPLLPEGAAIAAANGPRQTVASGRAEAMDALQAILEGQGIAFQRLRTSHAFHSPMMEPVMEPLVRWFAAMPARAPEIPYVSCVTGSWVDTTRPVAAEYWGRQCRAPVMFARALETVAGLGQPVLVEIGAGRVLTTFARQTLAKDGYAALLTSFGAAGEEATTLRELVAALWSRGVPPDWAAVTGPGCRRVSLPTYRFQRERHWVEPPAPAIAASSPPTSQEAPPSAVPQHINDPQDGNLPMADTPAPLSADTSRATEVEGELIAVLEDLSGEKIAASERHASFLELGFDSLFLAQVATRVQQTFKVPVTFRQLLADLPTIADLARHVASSMPVPTPASAPAAAMAVPAAAPSTPLPAADPLPAQVAPPAPRASGIGAAAGATEVADLFRLQLDAMQQVINQQIAAMQAAAPASAATPLAPPVVAASIAAAPVAASPAPAATQPAPPAPEAEEGQPMRFQVYRAAKAAPAALTNAQTDFIADLSERFGRRAAGSKAYTQQHRAGLADPRAAAGFRAEWKELVFPIVCARSKGPRIWDVDGNEYVDLVNGYGQTAFGHAPDFVLEAVARQMAEGFAIGPQSPLAGEVADLVRELTGNERVTFCNTGSEAVMAAMRVARTVTGRNRVVLFAGGYHGQFDEVLVKGGSLTAPPRALPVAPGIPTGSVGNMVVLPYANPDSVSWIRANADSIAAVITEPVQSRHPGLVPVDFLRELREITEASGTAFVLDEVVTGFRTHPGGMQAVLGIRADMATYGKVVGGGLPIGILAGSARFMDALDGGQWRYGDASVPEIAPTFFAGTFVRHPLALAAARAVLLHLREAGPALQQGLAQKTAALVGRINADLERRGIATRAETYSSWFYLNFHEEDRFGSLFFPHARSIGLHIQDGFPKFLTTTHGEAEIAEIERVFTASLDALQSVGILPGKGRPDDAVRPAAAAPAAPAAPAPEPLPERIAPTEPQREIWLAAQAGDAASCAFNESVSLRFGGALDADRLERALQAVVARHDALRGRFEASGEHFIVDDELAVPLHRLDASAAAAPEAELAGILADDAATPFDLVAGPLVRAQLVKLAPDAQVLVLTAHHIVCDGWSMNIILDELARHYTHGDRPGAPDLPAPMPFRRYAVQQAAPSGGREDNRSYWLRRFDTLPPDAELPSDRPRAAMKSFNGDTYRTAIDADLYRAAKKAGARQGATLFTTLASAFQIVMWRLTGEADQVAAIPTAGQSLVDEGPLVGHCVNFLPLRTLVGGAVPARELLASVQKAMLELNEHQDFTFGTLVRELRLPRNPSRLPLTQVQFNLERLGDALKFGELEARVVPNAKAFTNFDIFLNVIEGPDGLRLDCDYNTDLFDEPTIARWLSHFEQVLRALVEDAARPVRDLPILDADSLHWLAQTLNAGRRDDIDLRPLPELFRAQAARTPDATAVRWHERALSYAELDRASDMLAERLQRLVRKAGGRVGLLVKRSPDLVAGLLAIMKAGHAFVPLDPEHPEARLRLIADKAGLDALLSDDVRAAELVPGLPSIDLSVAVPVDEAEIGAFPPIWPQDSAYVIFTSGSTGTPKGVEISHEALANVLWSFAERPGFTAGQTLLAVTTVSFDIAILELFLPLVTGGTVLIADREQVRGGFGLKALIDAERPSHIQATPSLWRMLLEAGFRPYDGLTMLCGGEPLPRDLAEQLAGGDGELWNVYGPTETTIWSSAGRIARGEGAITIGEPVLNTQLHVVDASGQVAPVGVAGELVIGGLGLAKGYFGEPVLTAAAFRAGSPAGGLPATFYHTGDLARRLPDGRIQHLGRRDLQIKLRGFRIELEDIESAARNCRGVAAAAVALAGEGVSARLVGYYVEQPGETVPVGDLQQHMSQSVPDYMRPALWMRLDALPLTPNAKLDRKALPRPEAGGAAERAVLKPRNATEQTLAEIWAEVLQTEDIGIEDNLFTLGADSIQVFRIAARMLGKGLGLEARHLMLHPTIAGLAEVAEEIARSGVVSAAPPKLSSFRRNAAHAAPDVS